MDEPERLTWDTLVIYLQEVIEAMNNTLRDAQVTFGEEYQEFVAFEADFHNRMLFPRERLVPFVEQMRHRPTMQTLTPWLSLQTIRLFRFSGKALSADDEFAWVDAIEEGRFRLRRVQHRGPLEWDMETMCEGGVEEVTEGIEHMIRM